MTDPLHGADETAPPAVAPDGSPVLLYRRLKAGDEPDIIRRAVATLDNLPGENLAML